VDARDYLRSIGAYDEQPWASCPSCNFTGEDDEFDVLGAEEGKVWCNRCGEESRPETPETREKIQQALF
jgi:hypothetical protein